MAAHALWTPAQQAWLQALGCTVLLDNALAVDAGGADGADAVGTQPGAATAMPVEAAPAAPPSRPPRPAAATPAADRGAVRPTRAVPAQPPPAPAIARTGTARQPAVRLPDRLQIALLRASGCNPNDPATQALMDSWPLDTLRGNAAAKRALWPQLRALRRKPAP